METAKFYSNRFKQNIECDVLEERKRTVKLRTPEGIFEETIMVEQKYLDKIETQKHNGVSIYKFMQVAKKIKTVMEEKIIIKKKRDLSI